MNRRAALAKVRGLRPASIVIRRLTADMADAALAQCPTCGRLPAARQGKGPGLVYCRNCQQLANRHGCHWKRTYRAATLDPYRKAASVYIWLNRRRDPWIIAAVHALDALMAGSGPVERIVDVNELLKPPAKARAALARLRRAGIAPRRLLVNYLAVCCAIAEDPVSPGSEIVEYRRVQAAKAVFRLASGHHVNHGPGLRGYHRYPRSAGLALRHLGAWLEECCEHVREEHLDAILRFKTSREESRARRRADASPS